MSSTFDDLSGSITPEEKKYLLGKIQASLNLSVKDTDSIVSRLDGPEELKHRLTREVEKLSLLDRILLKITGFFRSRAVYEVMAERKLAFSRDSLRVSVASFFNFQREELTPEFAKAVYDVYAEAMALKPVFDHLFQQKLTFEAGLLKLLEEEYPAAAHQLLELFPQEAIEQHYRLDQKRSSLQFQLKKRLDEYLVQFPPEVMERVKNKLKPLYYLKHLVNYPYSFLFELFGHNPDKLDVTKYPYFLGTSWKKCAALTERLYYGLYLCTKFDWKDGSLNVLFNGVVDRLADGKATWTTDLINQRVNSLFLAGRGFANRVPWKAFLQWAFGDPYYSVKFYLPKFSLKDFYQTTLEIRFIDQLDELLPRVRQQILASEKLILFRGGQVHGLEHYVTGMGSSLGSSHQLKGFSYPESLGLLWGFLNQHFLRTFVPFFQSMSRMVQQANRSLLQPLANHTDDLGTLREKIARFDKSLHPDQDEGKDFLKLKYELASKPTSYKPFLQLVQNKDAQALELVERGLECLIAMHSFLSGLKDKNIPAFRSILVLPYLLEGQQETIGNGLDRILVISQKVIFVLKEALTLEA